ncbi:MAG: hypothetical protein P8R42_00545 [Candidatus Binatia bacterium]|nr:hypothetical protein [Candidatus Binatia bacterium]
MSFQLVDRIHEFSTAKSASGILALPDGSEDFPLSLVVEAIGQLAAYIAMDHVDFAMRPVAAIAGEVVATRTIRGGDRLDLSVDVSALRTSAMRYAGSARVNGEVAVELKRCTGAMLPMEAFDDPQTVREHLALLRGPGLAPRAFPTRREFAPRVSEATWETGRAAATLQAPEDASFYQDHFPLRPVYPATLLLDAKIAVAQNLVARDLPPSSHLPPIRAVNAVKVRAFTPPGGRVEVVVAETAPPPTDSVRAVKMEAFADGARVSTATVLLSTTPD